MMKTYKYLYRLFLGCTLCLCTGFGCLVTTACSNQENQHPTSSKQSVTFDTKRAFRNGHSFLTESVITGVRGQVRQVYLSQLGVRESTGRNDGEEVERYLKYVRLDKGYAWCAAFVCWVYGQSGVENPRTAWAASLFPQRQRIWQQGARVGDARAPQPGDIFGLYYASLKRIGHCGFVDSWGEKEVITVEGNTSYKGSREGDGVYRKRRPLRSIYAVADWIGREGLL